MSVERERSERLEVCWQLLNNSFHRLEAHVRTLVVVILASSSDLAGIRPRMVSVPDREVHHRLEQGVELSSKRRSLRKPEPPVVNASLCDLGQSPVAECRQNVPVELGNRERQRAGLDRSSTSPQSCGLESRHELSQRGDRVNCIHPLVIGLLHAHACEEFIRLPLRRECAISLSLCAVRCRVSSLVPL